MHQRILFTALGAVLAALSAHASAQGTGASTATAAVATVVATATPTADSRTSNPPAAGSDLALLFGGLGAIGFVSLRRGRFEG